MDSRRGKPIQAFHSGRSILADVFTGLLLVSLGIVLGMICNANFPESYLHPYLQPQPLTPPPAPAPSPETACVGPRSPSPAPRMEFADFLAPSAGGGGGGLMHNMTDEELLWRASMEPRRVDASMPRGIVHKVAFLFLVTADLPLRPLWEKFFAGHEGLYSIYVHARPGYAGSPPRDSVFYGRMIPSQNTTWGTMNLVDAERRLLGNALLDLANARFALFSESCAPLLSFPAVYAYLTGSRASFVESYDRPVGRLRHWRWFTNRGVSLEHWRKGSQWFQMHRALAAEFVAEARYIDVFKGGHGKKNMEEHYLPTLVTLLGWGARSQNRSLTNVDWSHSRGGHPLRYGARDVTAELIERLRKGEGNCGYNGGVADLCYMFARKFAPDTLGKLLELAPKVMGFG
uniref:Uncharacterized protein n=1 Tax=Avena sativa TaxID=4498 RepID=A0ACD5XY55_AVESA